MRYSIIIVMTLLALGQVNNSAASPYSQQLVADGRVLLFGSNNIPPTLTYSGLIEANDKFESAVTADPGDPEANLFYALSRVAVSYLMQGNAGSIETTRDLLEAFGMTRNLEDNANLSAYDDPPNINGTYAPPLTTPAGVELQSFLTGDFLPLIDAAVGNLNAITSQSFTTTLTTAETGDIFPLEIDYGDVLLLKSFLYTLKAFIQVLSAYDMDINLREAIILGNADVLQIQRDLLDKYNSFLSLHTDGDSRLTSAKATLMLAIDTSRSAYTFITSETDDQNDDLFSFGSDEEVAEASTAIAVLTEMQNSVLANRPYTETEEEWIISIVSGPQLNLYIIKDYNGDFVEGSMTDNMGFYAWINDYTVVGSTINIEFGFNYGGMCPGTLSTTGTLSGNQIIGGAYNSVDCGGSDSGSFTGTLENSVTETPLDLNYIFGNTGKSPFNIRGVLPEFDTDWDMIAGTFQQPYMNNLVPGISSELQLAKELGFSLVHDVKFGSITLDGNNDWSSNSAIAEDDVNDVYWDAPFGNDILKLYAARDSNSFYWMMELNDPPANNDTYYSFYASGKTNNTYYNSSIYNNSYNLYSNGILISNNPSDMGAGNVIEARIPLTLFNQTVKLDVEAWTNYDYIGDVTLRLPNDADLTGTVSCTSCTSSGKIFIYVFDGPDPTTSHILGTAVLNSAGSYTISGLPIGKEVYVTAHWDADDNGILTYGDYTGNSGGTAVEILESGTTSDINITVEFSGPLLIGGIFAENRAYSNFFTSSNDYYEMRGYARSTGNSLPVYAQNIPHSSGAIQTEIPYFSKLDLLVPPNYFYSGLFSPANGFSLPGMDWEGYRIQIYLDENVNGTLDPGEPLNNVTIPEGSLQQLDIPEVSITGQKNPTITWLEVPEAEIYRIWFWSVTEENGLGDVLTSAIVPADGSISYSFTYYGDLFSQYSTLAVSVMADDIRDSRIINRSTYVTTHNTKVNLPGVMLLLLD